MSPAVTKISERIKQHKALFAILIVGTLALFVGGMCWNDEPSTSKKTEEKAAAPPQQASSSQPQAAPPAQTLDGPLASQFVRWWISEAMDYSPNSAKPNHADALRWMDPQAAQGFQSCFWTPTIEQQVLSGQVSAAFQAVSVQAQAINPDGTIVVGVTGSLVMQSANAAPVTEQIVTDFLVKQEPQGLRISGLYNHSTLSSAASTY